MLHTHLHLEVALTRGTNGQALDLSKKLCHFGNRGLWIKNTFTFFFSVLQCYIFVIVIPVNPFTTHLYCYLCVTLAPLPSTDIQNAIWKTQTLHCCVLSVNLHTVRLADPLAGHIPETLGNPHPEYC